MGWGGFGVGLLALGHPPLNTKNSAKINSTKRALNENELGKKKTFRCVVFFLRRVAARWVWFQHHGPQRGRRILGRPREIIGWGSIIELEFWGAGGWTEAFLFHMFQSRSPNLQSQKQIDAAQGWAGGGKPAFISFSQSPTEGGLGVGRGVNA